MLQNDKCLVLFKSEIYGDIKQKKGGGQQVNQSQSVRDV